MTIPASWFGGNVTWVRGLYNIAAVPRYQAFMADMQGADTTNYAAIPATFNASISGTSMTVSSLVGPDDSDGFLVPGMVISGGGVASGTTIVSQTSGPRGSTGVYVVSVSQTVSFTTSLAGTVVASNNYSGGVLSTTVPVLPWVTTGTQLQAYYSYRDGTHSLPGQSMEGWPQLFAGPYQGTANDGDDYLMASLYHAYLTTHDPKYKALANRIGFALLEGGRWNSNDLTFSIPFGAQDGQVGFYYYNAATTTFAVNNDAIGLQIETTVNSGGPPYNYAGFGFWPTIPVTSYSAFNSLSVNMIGDGSGRYVSVNLNIDPAKTSAGNYYCTIPLLPEDSYAAITFTLLPSDFWQVGNVVYDASHQDYSYVGTYGSDVNTLGYYADLANKRYLRQFNYDFTASGPSGYASMYFGPAANSSAGTSGLDLKVYSAINALFELTALDSASVSHTAYALVYEGWNTLSIPWVGTLSGWPEAMSAGIVLGPNVTGFSQASLPAVPWVSTPGCRVRHHFVRW